MLPEFTLQRALLATTVVAMAAGIVPAGLVLDRQLAASLEARVRADLALAPRLLADRGRSNSDAMMMHAKDLAHVQSLSDALASGDRATIRRALDASAALLGDAQPVVIDAKGESFAGPGSFDSLVAETRAGKMPVSFVAIGPSVFTVALAPVMRDGRWIGAAGLATPFDARIAGLLAGLTRTGIVVGIPGRDSAAVTTLSPEETSAILAASQAWAGPADVRALTTRGRTLLAIAAPLGSTATVVFARRLDEELGVLPRLRLVALASALGAFLVALLLGAPLSAALARPVRRLAGAASALAAGQFDAPLPDSRLREVALMATAFGDMRRALAARLEDLGAANAALADRSARLDALQSDLMQRERLDATGRLVAQLAHEIRNPIANVRNCLELVLRRVKNDPEAYSFAEMAIEELLRMHELAEQMLDLGRPRAGAPRECKPVLVARDVARIATAGNSGDSLSIRIHGDEAIRIGIAPDALKQVLLNLVQNAREAVAGAPSADREMSLTIVELGVRREGANVVVTVADNGPGIHDDLLPRIFDPFFTTKEAVQGVGLGLFVAEGLVRTAGGRLTVQPRADGGGACFQLELPAVLSESAARPESDTKRVPHFVP